MEAQRKVPRCPRCRATPTKYSERWTDFSMSFDVEKDGRPEPEGILKEGNPDHVIAFCACGHHWRLRGMKQITELRPEGNSMVEDAQPKANG